MGIMGFHMLDLSDQFFIFFSWFVFSVDECFNDIAHEQFTSNFTPNYVEAITPRRYAEIYSTLDIAPGILNYEPISPNNQ